VEEKTSWEKKGGSGRERKGHSPGGEVIGPPDLNEDKQLVSGSRRGSLKNYLKRQGKKLREGNSGGWKGGGQQFKLRGTYLVLKENGRLCGSQGKILSQGGKKKKGRRGKNSKKRGCNKPYCHMF